jgi:hypothetical protein
VKLTTYLHVVLRSRIRGAIPPLSNTPSWCGAQLKKKKHRDNFTFTTRGGLGTLAIILRHMTYNEPVFIMIRQLMFLKSDGHMENHILATCPSTL